MYEWILGLRDENQNLFMNKITFALITLNEEKSREMYKIIY